MEAIDAGTVGYGDMVTASANAASMGGSQIYLKEGESMSVEDLLKSIVIASANDAAVALAEHLAGSEEAFVSKMNERAAELGMKSTKFENTNGLDDTTEEHLTSALDIAIMSRELIKHKKILEYSSTWMDSIRNGSFGLTNTNRLVRFYQGATGLKTGSTAKAKFCISATANKDGMELICVIMAADTRDIRNAEAKTLLDWGYSNYELYKCGEEKLGEIRVAGSNDRVIDVTCEGFSCVVKKGSASKIQKKTEILPSVSAPLKKGDKIGSITFTLGEETVGNIDIVSYENVDRVGYLQIFVKMIKSFFLSA
jgi:D-alanyl-D-alanine carboxypeptidase (penicillin-binding protein 5/6)